MWCTRMPSGRCICIEVRACVHGVDNSFTMLGVRRPGLCGHQVENADYGYCWLVMALRIKIIRLNVQVFFRAALRVNKHLLRSFPSPWPFWRRTKPPHTSVIISNRPFTCCSGSSPGYCRSASSRIASPCMMPRYPFGHRIVPHSGIQ